MDAHHAMAAIVAKFLRVDASTMHRDVPIGRAAFSSSVVMYRMFAELTAATGVTSTDPARISTFGDLLEEFGAEPAPAGRTAAVPAAVAAPPGLSIGIDVEMVANFTAVADYGADAFYAQHFTEREIADCLAGADPLQSFCGRYAAKEAVRKADAGRHSSSLRDVEIVTDAAGKPHCAGVVLSISHTPLFAVAVAVTTQRR